MGNLSQIAELFSDFSRFPTNFTHFFYTPHNVFLAISHHSPNSPIPPHFTSFPPILPFPPFFFTSAASWLFRLRITPMPAILPPFPQLSHFPEPLRLAGEFSCGQRGCLYLSKCACNRGRVVREGAVGLRSLYATPSAPPFPMAV